MRGCAKNARVLGAVASMVAVGCDAVTVEGSEEDTDLITLNATMTSQVDSSLECSVPYPTPDPGGAGAECVTEQISCGDVVEGNNTTGSDVYSSAQGEALSFCAGSASQTDKLDGPERIYELVLPEGTRDLEVRLLSCERSWLFWYQGNACDVDQVSCSYAGEGTFLDQNDDIALFNEPNMYFIIESDGNAGGNYRFSVDCYD